MTSSYKIIGDFIKQSKLKNEDGSIDLLLGVNLDKKFMPSVANLNGVDLTKYKVIKKGQFGCKLMSVGRDKKVPISRLVDYNEAIISSAYYVFEVIDENKLNAEYLMMWFSRPESDRFQWFQSGADIRGRITWEDFCSLPIQVPPIEKQRAIVKEYNTIVNRIKLNEQLNQKLEETAQALYKHWFVDFEFPDENGQPYKSSGGVFFYDNDLENDIPIGWRSVYLKDVTSKIGSGSTPRGGKESYKTSGISLIRSMNVYDFNFRSTDLAFISESQAEKLKNVRVLKGDVLFNITGASITRCCIVPRTILPARVNQHVAILRMSENLSNYLLCTMCYAGSKRELISAAESGSTREAITKEDLQFFRILMPSKTLGESFERKVDKLFKHKAILQSEHECLNKVKELLLSKMTRGESLIPEQVI